MVRKLTMCAIVASSALIYLTSSRSASDAHFGSWPLPSSKAKAEGTTYALPADEPLLQSYSCKAGSASPRRRTRVAEEADARALCCEQLYAVGAPRRAAAVAHVLHLRQVHHTAGAVALCGEGGIAKRGRGWSQC